MNSHVENQHVRNMTKHVNANVLAQACNECRKTNLSAWKRRSASGWTACLHVATQSSTLFSVWQRVMQEEELTVLNGDPVSADTEPLRWVLHGGPGAGK